MRADKIKKPNHVHQIIDERGFIFVHRYAWSHGAMRKVTRRMCKDGVLLKVAEDRDGFKYIRSQQGITMTNAIPVLTDDQGEERRVSAGHQPVKRG